MKIAHLVSTFPPYQGGMGNVAWEISRRLGQRGHQVEVFTPRLAGDETTRSGMTVRALRPLLHYGNAAFLPQLLWQLRGFDIIHLHYPFFGAAKPVWLNRYFHKKQKLVIQYHMDPVGQGLWQPIFYYYTKIFTPCLLRQADKIIISSFDYLENSQIKNFSEKFPKKFQEIPLGVDTNFFQPRVKRQALLEKLHLTAETPIVLFVGGLDKAHYFKGLEFLLQTKLKIKDISYKIIIVGEGNRKKYFQDLVEEKGIEQDVIFAGSVSNEELVNYYNLATVLVLPSIGRSEAFGLVLLEAMACAKPVIASNLPGVRAVVQDGKSGFLVKPVDVEDLTNKLRQILQDANLAVTMGAAGRKIAEEKYDWEKIVSQWEAVYEAT